MDKAQQEKENHESLVTVYETGNEAVVAVIKSVLDEAGIRYLAKGEGVQDLFGVGILPYRAATDRFYLLPLEFFSE